MNDFDRAFDALAAVDPDTSDDAIAQLAAEYLLHSLDSRAYSLSIFHDVRPSTARRIEKLREVGLAYLDGARVGPCPLPFDWSRKNLVGISTRDRERARQWIIDAMVAGYGVFRRDRGRYGWAFGPGSLAQIRERGGLSARAP